MARFLVPGCLLIFVLVTSPLGAEQIVIGTVETLDSTILRITIKTESGQIESFSVTNPLLLKRLEKNDRVKVEVGTDGMANQITKLPPPDEKHIPPGREPSKQ